VCVCVCVCPLASGDIYACVNADLRIFVDVLVSCIYMCISMCVVCVYVDTKW